MNYSAHPQGLHPLGPCLFLFTSPVQVQYLLFFAFTSFYILVPITSQVINADCNFPVAPKNQVYRVKMSELCPTYSPLGVQVGLQQHLLSPREKLE